MEQLRDCAWRNLPLPHAQRLPRCNIHAVSKHIARLRRSTWLVAVFASRLLCAVNDLARQLQAGCSKTLRLGTR